MHHYPFHSSDFNNATRHLTRLERSIYRDLLDLYYDLESPLPDDIQMICRRIIAPSQEEQDAVRQILSEFFKKSRDVWKHSRCDAEIANYKAKVQRNKSNGKAGGRPKKTQSVIPGFPDETQTITNGFQTKNQNQEPEPRTINHLLPLTPLGGKVERVKPAVEPVFPEGYPESHREPLRLWWRYKREKGQTYKPTGWQTLLNQQRHKSAAALQADISASIANNYHGIFAARTNGSATPRPADLSDVNPANMPEL